MGMHEFKDRFTTIKILFKEITGLDADSNMQLYIPFFNAFYLNRIDQGTDMIADEIGKLKEEIEELKKALSSKD